MQLKKRINLKIFIPVSLSATALFLLFSSSRVETIVILGVYAATLINLYLLMNIIEKIIAAATSFDAIEYSKFNMVLVFIGKMGIIFVALFISVQFVEKRVIIPLLNYVIQIFVLGVSFKRTG